MFYWYIVLLKTYSKEFAVVKPITTFKFWIFTTWKVWMLHWLHVLTSSVGPAFALLVLLQQPQRMLWETTSFIMAKLPAVMAWWYLASATEMITPPVSSGFSATYKILCGREVLWQLCLQKLHRHPLFCCFVMVVNMPGFLCFIQN